MSLQPVFVPRPWSSSRSRRLVRMRLSGFPSTVAGRCRRSALGELVAQMKPAEISAFEIGQSAQRLDVLDDRSLALDRNQILLAELLQGAVDMRNAQPERIADELLRQRHMIGAFFRQGDRLQPGQQ